MKIVKRYNRGYGENREWMYGISISVENDNGGYQAVFVDTTIICDDDSVLINIFNLGNKNFLDKNKIKNITHIDNNGDEHLIPLGIVDFVNRKYNFTELNLYFTINEEYYKIEEIINNIEEAIRIKYKNEKFINKLMQQCANGEEDSNCDLDK